jgi:dipeptidyl aminopeptidase/acylaminoacyl peptidase
VVRRLGDGPRRQIAEVLRESGPRLVTALVARGRTLAIVSHTRPGNTQWYSKLYLFPAEGGKPRVLLEDFDLDFDAPIWSPDSRTIFWSTGKGTRTELFGVDIASGRVTPVRAPRPGINGSWQLSKDGTAWVFSHNSGVVSPNLWIAKRQGDGTAAPVRLTDANPWIESEKVQLGAVETISWENSEGGPIEGVLTKPVGYTPGVRYPLIVNPHGGPSSANTESFSSLNQVLAANGFLVLQVNFRGSTGYGQKHLNANQQNWGIGDYDDIMTGVDALIARGIADPNRMVAYGWSYGGYMTFWMATQTDRFKLISPGAGLTNLYSMYSTTDIPAYLGWFFGTPWDNPAIYDKLSPIRHVKNVKSKILIMHGANDARVPPTQADEFYRALKDLGKDVTYVRYPRQGHGITETRLAMDRRRRRPGVDDREVREGRAGAGVGRAAGEGHERSAGSDDAVERPRHAGPLRTGAGERIPLIAYRSRCACSVEEAAAERPAFFTYLSSHAAQRAHRSSSVSFDAGPWSSNG